MALPSRCVMCYGPLYVATGDGLAADQSRIDMLRRDSEAISGATALLQFGRYGDEDPEVLRGAAALFELCQRGVAANMEQRVVRGSAQRLPEVDPVLGPNAIACTYLCAPCQRDANLVHEQVDRLFRACERAARVHPGRTITPGRESETDSQATELASPSSSLSFDSQPTDAGQQGYHLLWFATEHRHTGDTTEEEDTSDHAQFHDVSDESPIEAGEESDRAPSDDADDHDWNLVESSVSDSMEEYIEISSSDNDN